MHWMAPCSPHSRLTGRRSNGSTNVPSAFSRPGKPTRTSTRPTNSTAGLQWYDTSADKEYADQADRDKLARLTDDVEPFVDDDRRAELDKLDAWEIPWLLIPAEELPGPGNLRTECDQLVMSLRGDTYDTVELRWICYMKHTDVELRTFDISSEDIDRWLAELEQGDHHAEEAPHSRS